MDYLSCSNGRLSIPSETTLFDLLSQCFTKFVDIFDIQDEDNVLVDPSSLERVLSCIFDTESRAFVTEKSLRLVDRLDDHDKLSLFIQAVTGLTMIFQRLSASETGTSKGHFSTELSRFNKAPARREMLDEVAASHLLTECYDTEDLADLLLQIVEDDEADSSDDDLPWAAPREAIVNDSEEWDVNRPCKKMGLPWGFTIMALN